MNFFEQAAACDTIGGTGATGPNQSFRTVPSPSHQPHSASVSQTSLLHNLLPSQTSSVHMRPFDAIVSHNSGTIQPSSLVQLNPTLLPPMTSTQTTVVTAASPSLSVLPPVHPPLASHQPQSVPLHHHPFPLHMLSPAPPHGMPLLQPFPPPKPSPLLTPAASYAPELTRDQVKGALLRLVQVLFLDCTMF
jgi:mRNA-decapping enzyme 1B